MSAGESWKMEAGFLVFRCDLVPHLLCQYDQGDCVWVCWLAIYPSLRSTKKHISASHLARGRIEAAQQLSYSFRWQSRSGKLIKLIIQTSKHQEWEQGGTDEFLLHSKLHLPLVLMESVQSADGSRLGGEDIVAMEIKTWREIGTGEAVGASPSLQACGAC